MAGSSFFALLDDIASMLDDVAAMTKIAARKTAGVLGDDLALNAQQVSGVHPERELPVIWTVAKGSLLNKAILVPAALAISAFAPWAITPLLVVGGVFLCFEGAEKLAHKFLHPEDAGRTQRHVQAILDEGVDMVEFEKEKIKGAIRTDFILSAEIIVISLGAVANAALPTRIATLTAIALLMTVGVYGLVAAIVKLDDLGLRLSAGHGGGGLRGWLGRALLRGAPWLMKALSVAGTAAMFLVGGGILVHAIPSLHHLTAAYACRLGLFGSLLSTLATAAAGIVAGALVLGAVTLVRKLRSTRDKRPADN